MAAPTGLTIKNNLNDMQIGDCIPCRYTAASGQAGFFSELGSCVKDEIPVTGSAAPDGLFYLIKVNKGMLIADRVIQTSISWDALNNSKFIEGCNSNYVAYDNSLNNISTAYTADSTYNGEISKENWVGYTGESHWFKIDLGSSKYLKGFKIKNNSMGIGVGNTTYALTSIDVYISNDDLTYEKITNLSATTTTIHQFILSIPKLARYIKFVPLAGNTDYLARLSLYQVYTKSTPDNFEINSNIRSLFGGCAYVDSIGNSSLTDKSLGAWPISNEWDKYIVNSDLKGKVIKGDDNIWHWKNINCFVKETPINGLSANGQTGDNAKRLTRGLNIINNIYLGVSSNNYGASTGFRPVLNYVETDIASEVIY